MIVTMGRQTLTGLISNFEFETFLGIHLIFLLPNFKFSLTKRGKAKGRLADPFCNEKGPVKLIEWVKKALLFLHVTSKFCSSLQI